MISDVTRRSVREGAEERRRQTEEWTRGRGPEPVEINALLAQYAVQLLDEVERLEGYKEPVPDFVERWAKEHGMAFSRRPGARHMHVDLAQS